MGEVAGTRQDRSEVVAALRLPVAAVDVLSIDLVAFNDHVLREENSLRLDLSVNARMPGSVLHFQDHWAANRYERPGRLFLLPPGETLHIRSGVGRQDAVICRLPIEPMKAWLEDEIEWTDRRLDASADIPGSIVDDLILRLAEEARHPGFATGVLGEALAVQIAVTLERYFRNIFEPAPARGLSPLHLRRIEERVRDWSSAPTLSDLAALCGLSVRHLSREFRLSRGVSLGAYVAAQRLGAAKQFLRGGETVKGVAYRMGFGSPSTFSYAFRKAAGMSPGQYRSREGFHA